MTQSKDPVSQEGYLHIKEDIADIKLSLRGVMEILQRFAVMEERIAVTTKSMSSIQSKIEQLGEKQQEIEKQQTYFKASAKTFAYSAKIAWALGGGVVVTILNKVIQLAF